jgi:hypothetical protein
MLEQLVKPRSTRAKAHSGKVLREIMDSGVCCYRVGMSKGLLGVASFSKGAVCRLSK